MKLYEYKNELNVRKHTYVRHSTQNFTIPPQSNSHDKGSLNAIYHFWAQMKTVITASCDEFSKNFRIVSEFDCLTQFDIFKADESADLLTSDYFSL